MDPNETPPQSNQELEAEADEQFRRERAAEAELPYGGAPDFAELLEHLEQQLLGGTQRDEARHDAQMKKVGECLRAAAAQSDAEQLADRAHNSEAEPLAWGVWKSKCGCLHLAVPDGRGGWAVSVGDVDPAELRRVVSEVVSSLGETALAVLQSLPREAP